MLVRFTVGNFLSFKKPQTFSMIAGPVQKHKDRLYQASDTKLLKFASLYGANAAGKSNLVKAMKFTRDLVLKGLPDNIHDRYFKLDHTYQEKPSYFEFEICIDNTIYSYGIELKLTSMEIMEEWFIRLGASQNQELFYRNTHTGQYHFDRSLFDREDAIQRFDIYMNDLSTVGDALFLNDIISNKEALYAGNDQLMIFKKVVQWFSDLDISFPTTPISGYSCFSSTSPDQIMKAITAFSTGISHVDSHRVSRESALEDTTPAIKEKINKALSALADTSERSPKGIRLNCNGRLYLIYLQEDEPVFNEITFRHGSHQQATFSLSEESEGTQRLLDMLTVLLCTKDSSVFIIDEIDRSLHPRLTVHFIKNFLEIARAKNIQLIITTHESHLLDLSILRQDEIWFAEKDRTGASQLIPFDRFKERFDKKVEKAYLDGRYGGVPLFDTFFFPDSDHAAEDEPPYGEA